MSYICKSDQKNFPNLTQCYRGTEQSDFAHPDIALDKVRYDCVIAGSGKNRKWNALQDEAPVGDNCGVGHTDNKLLCYEFDINDESSVFKSFRDTNCNIGFGTFNFNDDLKFVMTEDLPASCVKHNNQSHIMDCTEAYNTSGCRVDRDNRVYRCPGELAELILIPPVV